MDDSVTPRNAFHRVFARMLKILCLISQERISLKETAPVRKVIQVSTMVHPEKDWAFIALCDDGSLWLYHGSWSRIQNIPQTTDL